MINQQRSKVDSLLEQHSQFLENFCKPKTHRHELEEAIEDFFELTCEGEDTTVMKELYQSEAEIMELEKLIQVERQSPVWIMLNIEIENLIKIENGQHRNRQKKYSSCLDKSNNCSTHRTTDF